jgi:hypothetical protein
MKPVDKTLEGEEKEEEGGEVGVVVGKGEPSYLLQRRTCFCSITVRNSAISFSYSDPADDPWQSSEQASRMSESNERVDRVTETNNNHAPGSA